jgi:hypothetical protein
MVRSFRSSFVILALVAFCSATLPDLGARWQGLPGIGTAAAQTGGDFKLDNISFSFGPTRYTAKRVDVIGATIPRAGIEALFRPADQPFEQRLAKLGAKLISIPELTATTTIAGEEEVVVYRDVQLKDIVAGRVAEMTIAASEMAYPGTTFELRYGRTSVRQLDLPVTGRIYEHKAGTDAGALLRMYADFAIENITARDKDANVDTRIARIAGRDFSARPLKDGWASALSIVTELSAKDELSADDQKKIMPLSADVLGSFGLGFIEATEIEIDTIKRDQSGTGKARIARIAYTGAANGQPSEARVEGLELVGTDGRIAIASTSQTGFSIAPTLDGLKALGDKPVEQWDEKSVRALMPVLGTFRQSGVMVDIPRAQDAEKPGSKPWRIQATLKDSEFTGDKLVDGIPTNIRFAWENLLIRLPKEGGGDWVETVRSLGYDALETSAAIWLNWDSVKNEVTLRDLTLSGERMGRVSIQALLGNVPKEAFLGDGPSSTAAWIGARAKSLTIRIEDFGLSDHYLAMASKAEKTSPEALRKSYKEMVEILASGFLGTSKDAAALRMAASAFADKPRTLVVTAKSKDPSGVAMLDLMGLSEPKTFLEKLDITAKVEDRP